MEVLIECLIVHTAVSLQEVEEDKSWTKQVPARNTFFCVTFLNFLLHRKTQKTKKKNYRKMMHSP